MHTARELAEALWASCEYKPNHSVIFKTAETLLGKVDPRRLEHLLDGMPISPDAINCVMAFFEFST